MSSNASYLRLLKRMNKFKLKKNWDLTPYLSKYKIPLSVTTASFDIMKNMLPSKSLQDLSKFNIGNFALSSNTSFLTGLGSAGKRKLIDFSLPQSINKSLQGSIKAKSALHGMLNLFVTSNLSKTYENFYPDINQFPASLADFAGKLKKFSTEISKEEIEYSDEESIQFGGEKFTLEELNDDIESIYLNYSRDSRSVTTLEETNKAILGHVEKFEGENVKRKKAALKLWLLALIFQLFISFFSPHIEKFSQQIFGLEPREAIKKIKKIVVLQVEDKEKLKKSRIVIADILNVREKPKRKSKKLGRLYWGYKVELIKKKRSWSLVNFQNENEEIILKGWVFNRYLTKCLNN